MLRFAVRNSPLGRVELRTERWSIASSMWTSLGLGHSAVLTLEEDQLVEPQVETP